MELASDVSSVLQMDSFKRSAKKHLAANMAVSMDGMQCYSLLLCAVLFLISSHINTKYLYYTICAFALIQCAKNGHSRVNRSGLCSATDVC